MKKSIIMSVMVVILVVLLCGCSNKSKEKENYGYTSSLTSYSTDDNGIVKMDEIQDMIELDTWYFTSGVPNNAIKVKYPNYENEDATFELSTNKGSFMWQNNYVKNATLKPNDDTFWHEMEELSKDDKAYVDIILKVDNKIIGYAVIEIVQNNSSYEHNATLIESAIFPKIDKKHQTITDAKIKVIIENAKNK